MAVKKEVRKAKKGDFSYLPGMIRRNFEMTEPEPIVNLIVCHRLLYEKANYHKSGSKVYGPERFFKKLSGDCQDHGATLASMLDDCGLEVCLLQVGQKGKSVDHLIVQVANPLDSVEEVLRSIRRYYKYQFGIYAREIGYESHRGNNWFVADTAGDKNAGWTRYIGQISSYTGDSMVRNPDNSWSWYNLKDRRRVR